MVQENKDVRLIGWRKHIRCAQYISRDHWGIYIWKQSVIKRNREGKRDCTRTCKMYYFLNVLIIYIQFCFKHVNTHYLYSIRIRYFIEQVFSNLNSTQLASLLTSTKKKWAKTMTGPKHVCNAFSIFWKYLMVNNHYSNCLLTVCTGASNKQMDSIKTFKSSIWGKVKPSTILTRTNKYTQGDTKRSFSHA